MARVHIPHALERLAEWRRTPHKRTLAGMKPPRNRVRAELAALVCFAGAVAALTLAIIFWL